MPTYEYECNSCHSRFEKRQGFHDEPVAQCPKCQGSGRLVFYPAPIIFKGGGFYVTDSRPSSGGNGDGSGAGSETGSGAGSETSSGAGSGASSEESGSGGEKPVSTGEAKGSEE